jgi:hypothetical protein
MRRAGRPGDFDEDIKFHIEEETAGNLARGMMPEEARPAALRKFGHVLQAREAVREVWIPAWADQAAMDLRYAMRTYRNSHCIRLLTSVITSQDIILWPLGNSRKQKQNSANSSTGLKKRARK